MNGRTVGRRRGKEGKRGSAKSCLGGRGARREACYFNHSSRDGREPGQSNTAQPKVLQLNSFPQTQTDIMKRPTQSQRGKGAGRRGRRVGLSRRVGQCAHLNPLQRSRIEKYRKIGRTNAPPQSSLQRFHRYLPKSLQTNIQNIPTAASQRSASRPGRLPLPQHAVDGCSAGRRVVKSGIYGSRTTVPVVAATRAGTI